MRRTQEMGDMNLNRENKKSLCNQPTPMNGLDPAEKWKASLGDTPHLSRD